MEFDDDVSAVVNFVLKAFDYPPCIEISYNSVIKEMSNVTDFSGIRQWFYQSCSEFGWYPTSGSQNQPFGSKFPLDLYTSICAELFGKEYSYPLIETYIAETNKLLGGRNPNVSNVYMIKGQLDPWQSIGCRTGEGCAVVSGK